MLQVCENIASVGEGERMGDAQPGRDMLSGVGPADRKSAEHSVMKLLNYEMTSQTRLVDYSNLLD